jgi:competence protein ComEC
MNGFPRHCREWVAAASGRHPLFVAALVAAGCVAVASLWGPAAVFAGAVFALLGCRLQNWRVGLAWGFCGWFAGSVFLVRDGGRRTDERVLLAATGADLHGWTLKDGRGTKNFWTAPVTLQDGPRPGAKVWWEGAGAMPVAGSQVSARGDFLPLPPARNPGEFDRASWLRAQGVSVTVSASRPGTVVQTGKWAALGAEIRRGFRAAITDGLPETSRQAVVIRAVVMGESPQDADELVAAFRNSGTLHAFSVSGLHVSMVGALAWLVLRLCGISRRWSVLALLPMIFAYSWLTGNSPPAVRSAWMAAVFLGAFVSRRRPDLLNALGAVLLAAMLWDGRLLFQPGVQLSYGVVAAIAVGASWGNRAFAWLSAPELYLPQRMMNRWQRFSLWIRRKLAQSLGVSLVAAVGSTPLTMFHFGLFTPVSVLAGVAMVPTVFALLAAALLAAVLHPWVPPLARTVNRLNGRVADACVGVAEFCAALPGGHFQIRGETQPFLLVYDLDRGSGAGVFSDGNDAAVLMDCGSARGFQRRIVPSLRRLGVVPDAVILSHPDGDHLGGGTQVWGQFPIRQSLLPVSNGRSPGFQAWLQDAPRVGIRTFQAADLHDLAMPDGARLEIIHVADASAPHAAADDRVAIYRLHWRGWKILFTSDSGIGTELEMLDRGGDISADVIIAGHHTGDASLSDRFLDAVNPRAIVASHADFPVEERLDPSAVAYWRSRGIHVFPQGQTGGVTIRVDGSGNLRLEGFVDHSLVILKRR